MNKLILVMAIPFLCSCNAKYRVLPEDHSIAKQPFAARQSEDQNKSASTIKSWSVCAVISSLSHLLWNDNPAVALMEPVSNDAKDKSIIGVAPQAIPTAGRLTTGQATISQGYCEGCYSGYSKEQAKSFSVVNGFYRLTEIDPAVNNMNLGPDKNRNSLTGETFQGNGARIVNGFMKVDITN